MNWYVFPLIPRILLFYESGFAYTDGTGLLNKSEVGTGNRQQFFLAPLVSWGMEQEETGLFMQLGWVAVANKEVVYMCLSPEQLQRCFWRGLFWATVAWAFVFIVLCAKLGAKSSFYTRSDEPRRLGKLQWQKIKKPRHKTTTQSSCWSSQPAIVRLWCYRDS